MIKTYDKDEGFIIPPTESLSEPPRKLCENSTEKLSENLMKNNGGDTDYYRLPGIKAKPVLMDFLRNDINLDSSDIVDLFDILNNHCIPKTLNDLIEYKNMPFWRGEIMKAIYGLEGRMQKNKDSSQAEIRELHKIIYYANRRLDMLKGE